MYKLPDIQIYREQIKEAVNNKTQIIVFGSGMLGRAVVDLLLEMNACVNAIFDNNPQKAGQKYKGIMITTPKAIEIDGTIVIIAVYEYMAEIKQQLIELGVERILPYYCCFFGQEIDEEIYWNNDASIQDASFLEKRSILSRKEDYVEVDSLDITITERCSLRCKNCANLIQYYHTPVDESFEKNSYAVKRLARCVDLIGRVSILGGEPLLNKDVARYVELCRNISNIENILVVTNGTLTPKEDLIKELKSDDRCVLSVSNYGSLSRKKDEIIEIARTCGLKIAISRRESGIWRELGRVEYSELNQMEHEQKWDFCMMKKFLAIKDGKLFVCPFAANAYKLQAIAEKDVEYVDLLDETISDMELRTKIKEFLMQTIHSECKYCIEKGKRATLIPAAEQIAEPMQYKRYEYTGDDK